ncbi:MAG: hypothetical protein EOP11_01070 [Proteobacteria bacterium]|nr:MAG: hypothetical protein EOP11_01070 [Pseudomonadota bacterium]
MKKIILSLLLLPLISLSAFAELKLDPPQALLKRAQTGRTEAREVILDLQQNISEFVDPQTFDAYFSILDQLEKIADEQKVNEIYPNAVKALGQQMVANGIRWLTVSRDPIERIMYYHRWMNMEIAASFLSNVEMEEKTLTQPQAMVFAQNLEVLIPWIDKAFPQASSLRLGYRTVISERAARSLGREDLSEEDRLFWLAKVYTASGFSSALNYIQDGVLHLSKEKQANLHVYIHRYLTIANRLAADGDTQPFWLTNLSGDTAQIIAMRAVFLMETISEAEFRGLLGAMQANDLQALTGQWIARPPKEAYLNEYLKLTKYLANELKGRELSKEANEMARYFVKISAPTRARQKLLEGTYALKDASGKEWIFTAAFARGSEVFVGLSDKMGFVSKSYFFLSYVEAEDLFIASERERSEDSYRNWAVKFKMKEDGAIEVTDLAATKSEQFLRGKKVQSYPNYFPESSATPVDPAGRYEGILLGKKMTLEVTAYNGLTTAQMYDDMHHLNFDLSVGTFATDSVLYLTTGMANRATWIQLRGVIKDGAYRGQVIKGGKGLVGKEFVLKKVSK